MPQLAKTGLTMLVLVGIVAAGIAWGWKSFTSPLPERAVEPAICTATEVAKGDEVFPEDVTVSVYNASRRVGLAGRTLEQLNQQGFGIGSKGNAPDGTKVRVAEIWVADKRDPAALLVKSYLGPRVKLRRLDGLGLGLTVVVGTKFDKVTQGRESVVAKTSTTVCTPPRGTV